MSGKWNAKKLLQDLCDDLSTKEMLEAIAAHCDRVSSENPGKPQATIASINANLIRQALGRMVR